MTIKPARTVPTFRDLPRYPRARVSALLVANPRAPRRSGWFVAHILVNTDRSPRRGTPAQDLCSRIGRKWLICRRFLPHRTGQPVVSHLRRREVLFVSFTHAPPGLHFLPLWPFPGHRSCAFPLRVFGPNQKARSIRAKLVLLLRAELGPW